MSQHEIRILLSSEGWVRLIIDADLSGLPEDECRFIVELLALVNTYTVKQVERQLAHHRGVQG